MKKTIIAIAVIGMTLWFGLASTPGLAGEAASLQFVGYKHGNYCQSRECC